MPSHNNNPKLHIFTPVWGPHFTDLLTNALGMSFRWPKNQETLENATWSLVVDEQNAGVLGQAKAILPTAKIQALIYPELKNPNAEIGAIKMRGLLWAMKQCLEENTPMLMATPDFIYGDGSIDAMLKASHPESDLKLCVSIAHMRALPKTITDIQDYCRGGVIPSNARLLRLAIDQAHSSWVHSHSHLDDNACYHSGMSIQSLSPSISLVQHHMPSPFLVNFTPKDRTDFSIWKGLTAPAFGEWDHNWPKDLIDQGRLRYIGGSDAACMIEITEAHKNVPPVQPKAPKPGEFFLNNYHNLIQKQFLAVFRHE